MSLWKRIVFVALVTAINFSLALIGWGGIGPYFDNQARTTLAWGVLVLAVAAVFVGGSVSPGEREDKSNRWVLLAFTLIGLADGFLPAYADRMDFWILGGEGLRWTGVALFLIGGVFRLWPVYVLGRRFSGLVAIQPGHTLVTTGIYGLIRNPSYLGLLLNVLGWGLVFRSAVGVLITVLTLIPLVARMNAEERLLASQFGDEFEAYRSRTWRLIPWVY